jgi:GH43 family beta-xylosidase
MKTLHALTIVITSVLMSGSLLSCDTVVKQQPEYDNPIVKQRADPWVYRTDAGDYYLVATVPEYDRIEIRKSETINGLADATPKVLWTKHEEGAMGYHIWAPELHRIDGKWYIYFAAAGL